MSVQVDVWLRGENNATTQKIDGVPPDPRAWTDDDVRQLIEGMLLAMHRMKHPEQQERPVSLRGLSWIVNPFDAGGVVIAIEITMGAVIAGPFDIEQAALEAVMKRVLARPTPAAPTVVH
jgi:hypothetical protein